ncbi:hypothetical protein [Neobacillus sp. NPDC093127]|uniref:hypothetical protein n=1 Tax=Neobacillus sp. NPDC093127 TaxID=3364296 RepID=UPI0037FE25AF
MKLGIMCGMPLSGKSTYSKTLQKQGWVRVAKEFGLTLEIFHVDTDYETCKQRNRALRRLSENVLKQIYK